MNDEQLKDIELRASEKYKPVESMSDENLKDIAKGIYNHEIFTDRHCRPSDITRVFMVLSFMGPTHPSNDDTSDGKRDNAIFDLVERDIESKYYEARVKTIGMIYEYLDKRGPTSINGLPIFMSLRLLNIEDAAKVWEYYEKYKLIREQADNF